MSDILTVFINMLLEGARVTWPSLTKQELLEAGSTVAKRYRDKRATLVDLSRAMDEELKKRHGKPPKSRRG